MKNFVKRNKIILLIVCFIMIVLTMGCQKETIKQEVNSSIEESGGRSQTSESENTEKIQETLVEYKMIEESSTRIITDMANRVVEIPKDIHSIFAVNNSSSIFLYTLAPDLMIGWNSELSEKSKGFLNEAYTDLPALGMLFGNSKKMNPETIIAAAPDFLLFVFAGITESQIEAADNLETKTGIPVVMVDGGIDTYDEAYIFMGEVINRKEHAGELADFCIETLEHITELTENISEDMMKKVYYARGEDGLTTEPEGSVNQELLSNVGVVNIISEDMTQQSNAVVSIEQIMAGDPDVILIGSAGFSIEGSLDYIENGIGWLNINAVMNESVYKIPQLPFNWFDRPPSVNRIIGLEWLAYTLYPENYDKEFNQILIAYFDLFYHIELKEGQIQTLIK